MQAASHGAKFPMAEKLRKSMSSEQLKEFSVGSESGKPEHVAHHSPPAAYPTPSIINTFTSDGAHTNMNAYKSSGMNELEATKAAIKKMKPYGGQHRNLGKHLIPRKDGKPHGSDYNF